MAKLRKGKSVKGKNKKSKNAKSKSVTKTKKSVRAGASASRDGTLAFSVSGCTSKLVKALDKAALVKANKDGHRVSRSRLVTSILEKKFL